MIFLSGILFLLFTNVAYCFLGALFPPTATSSSTPKAISSHSSQQNPSNGFTQDYCDPDLCPRGKTHIGCRNTGKWGSTCGSNPELKNLSNDDKQFILDMHNADREKIAGGSMKKNGYEPAVNMVEIGWNDELAHIACFNAIACVFAHDDCRNTATYRYSGQNLAIVGQSNGYKSFEEAYKDLHSQWFNENKDANMKLIRKYESKPGPQIGHFTQIVSDKAREVGCCISKFERNGMKYVYIVCNYSYTNILGQPIYIDGQPKCQKVSKKYKSLCVA